MGITRTVTTQVYCDVCGKWVIGWESEETGVSREWAKYHARCKGCTAGQKVICKECRIKQRIKKCSLQKKWGAAGMDGGACLGFSHDGDDEPIERCKRCIAYTSFDWDEEKRKAETMRKQKRQTVKKLIQCAAIIAAGVLAIILFMWVIWCRGKNSEPVTDEQVAAQMQQAEPLVIETPEAATEGSIRVYDYDGCCIYSYYGKIRINNDGKNGKDIDVETIGYLEGYQEHKDESEAGNERGIYTQPE